MEIFIISLTALLASCLTLFSGFGLGTILTPVFLFFFPLNTAIALTAVVHFLNNIFKLTLLWRKADFSIVARFGLPALLAAFVGAKSLFLLGELPRLYAYKTFGREMVITPVKLTIAILILIFVILELSPSFSKMSFSPKFLPLGGVLSGFFGGLSGHQGALRSTFLVKCKLSKEVFIATGVVIACLVDVSRLTVYWRNILKVEWHHFIEPMSAAVLSAFAGAWLGNRFMKKVTMKMIQVLVFGMLCIIAVLLGLGVI